jgi:cell division protein FtsN
MADRDSESGHQLVLDNRKLIIILGVLIIIGGLFFIEGYKLGKHQGYLEGEQAAAESARKVSPIDTPMQASKPTAADTSAAPLKTDSEEQQLNWYKNAIRKEGTPEVTNPKTAVSQVDEVKDSSSPTKATTAPVKEQKKEPAQESSKKSMTEKAGASKPLKQAAVSQTVPINYSVQVGAFRMKSEVESKAKTLRAQGYECRIEEPKTSDDFYLLKVGKYKNRADATVMLIRLKKNGYTAIIKTN